MIRTLSSSDGRHCRFCEGSDGDAVGIVSAKRNIITGSGGGGRVVFFGENACLVFWRRCRSLSYW